MLLQNSWRVVLAENWQQGGFGLYVHWPFCQAKCPYCDFNSHVVSGIDQDRWAKALAREIKRWSERTPDRVLRSIFFGGGTPSLMNGSTVETILRAAQDGWTWSNDIEITLEANPTSVEAERFRDYAMAGVNRVSLGVQALNDTDLKRLGRLHDVATALKALKVARDVFARVSFDLIYARQDQTLPGWRSELETALAYEPDHMSLYQLTIEPGTAFWDRQLAGGLKGLPDEDLAADMYDATQDICGNAGLAAYEVSNHAKNGCESRHNLVYWRYGDWVGVGPGAHGRITGLDGKRVSNVGYLQPGRWLQAAESGSGDETLAPVSERDAFSEMLMMGLRLSEGIDLQRLATFGSVSALEQRVDELSADGFLWRDDTRFGTTDQGRLLLNRVVTELLPDEE